MCVNTGNTWVVVKIIEASNAQCEKVSQLTKETKSKWLGTASSAKCNTTT